MSWALLSSVCVCFFFFFFSFSAGVTLLRFPPPTASSARTTPTAGSTHVACWFALFCVGDTQLHAHKSTPLREMQNPTIAIEQPPSGQGQGSSGLDVSVHSWPTSSFSTLFHRNCGSGPTRFSQKRDHAAYRLILASSNHDSSKCFYLNPLLS